MRLTELVQRPKNTFSTYRFTTTGIVDIFSHLKNCPALLLHDFIIILIALLPVEKQVQVRVPLVWSVHKLFLLCFFLTLVHRGKKEPTGGVLGGV